MRSELVRIGTVDTGTGKTGLIYITIKALILALFVVGSIGFFAPVPLRAATDVPGEVSVPGEDALTTGEPAEEDFQACATLIGEGELCGWAQVDPETYDPETGNPPEPPPTGQAKCPVPVQSGVVCTGPEIPSDLPHEEGEDGKGDDEEPVGGGADVPPCDVAQGNGVVCDGPEESEEGNPDESDSPADNDGTESDGTESDGTESDGTESDGTESDGTESNDTETDGTGDDAENSPEPDAEDCVQSVGSGSVGCGPEVPAGGQEIRTIQVFVPALSWQN